MIRIEYTDNHFKREGVPVKKGLPALLSMLREKGIKRAVATSTGKARAVKIISLAGILEEFDCITGGDEVAKSKPEPDIFLEAAKQLKTDPAHCIVLEDSDRGIYAALAAGMLPIMVPDIKPPPPLIIEKGIIICQTLDDVATLLNSIL